MNSYALNSLMPFLTEIIYAAIYPQNDKRSGFIQWEKTIAFNLDFLRSCVRKAILAYDYECAPYRMWQESRLTYLDSECDEVLLQMTTSCEFAASLCTCVLTNGKWTELEFSTVPFKRARNENERQREENDALAWERVEGNQWRQVEEAIAEIHARQVTGYNPESTKGMEHLSFPF